MGHKGITDNLLVGPTINPHKPAYNSGGSSGGAAVSVAAALAALAQGSDGGGSVRIPAAMSGVVGVKSSAGAVPEVRRPDAFQAATPFQTIGALARTVEDAAILTRLFARPDSRDPFSVPMFEHATLGSQDVVIGFDPVFGNFPVAGDVAQVVAAAISRITTRHRVTDVPVLLPDHAELAELWRRLVAVQTAFIAETLEPLGVDLAGAQRQQIPPELAELIDLGRGLSALDHRRDSARRTLVLDTIETAFVTPTLAVAGVRNGQWGRTVGPASIDGRAVETTIGWTMTYPVNFSGHPALSLPIGFTAEGLPVGLQLIGRRWYDIQLLELASGLEALLAG